MSSSRQSSRTDSHGASGACPTCGKRRVVHVTEDVTLSVGRRRHCFEDVPHERCLACGERIFDLETSGKFDAMLSKKRRRRAA